MSLDTLLKLPAQEVRQTLQAAVFAGVYVSVVDGELAEREVEALVDGARAVAEKLEAKHAPAVGAVLDSARQAVKLARAKGAEGLLDEAVRLTPLAHRDLVLALARRLLRADGTLSGTEAEAFRVLAERLASQA